VKNDPIIEEIQKIRREYAKRFNDNLHSICEDARKKQTQKGRHVIAANPKPLSSNHLGEHAA
jgi:hypothetical protein